MIFTLIGMSGVGKTYWSNRLEKELGYVRIGCDDRINTSLSLKLSKLGVKADFRSLSAWRGLPYQEGYAEKEALQIETEQEVMRDVVLEIQNRQHENIVIDTGGSVIYSQPETLSQLKNLTTCIYIQAGEQHINDLYTDEVIFERPLIWGKEFVQRNGETGKEAMKRSYADVLSWRSLQYEQLAARNVSFESARMAKSAESFLNL